MENATRREGTAVEYPRHPTEPMKPSRRRDLYIRQWRLALPCNCIPRAAEPWGFFPCRSRFPSFGKRRSMRRHNATAKAFDEHARCQGLVVVISVSPQIGVVHGAPRVEARAPCSIDIVTKRRVHMTVKIIVVLHGARSIEGKSPFFHPMTNLRVESRAFIAGVHGCDGCVGLIGNRPEIWDANDCSQIGGRADAGGQETTTPFHRRVRVSQIWRIGDGNAGDFKPSVLVFDGSRFLS